MIRWVATAAALLVCAFFVLAVRQSSSTAAATKRLNHPTLPSDSGARRTATLLRHAGTLNPDAEVDILRARLALQSSRVADARRLLLGVVGREPANAEAWTAIALAFATTDPGLVDRAHNALRRLVPNVPAA